jgi:O-acetyl-ADP-ribose deacetylase (regulator of RNase III)
MRIPRDVSDTLNAYLAFRAALRAVLAHNESDQPRIDTVLCPGLGTAVGRMPVERCARQMRAAWDRVLGGQDAAHPSLRAAAQDELELSR